jgi:type IV pilus assembly protein PilV
MRVIRYKTRGRQSGVTMIELMIAGMVMVVGFLGMMILITTAIAFNNRNKMDTNATLAAQMVFEEVRSDIATGSSPTLTDCGGTAWTIGVGSNTVGATAGATLAGATVDFTAAKVTNYSMDYKVCTANGGQATYDVRWNVQTLSSGVSLVTVGAKAKGASSDLKYFALPVTLRGIAGS